MREEVERDEPHRAAKSAFKVQGLDCAEEVAILRREIGPLVGGESNLAFDVLNGRMTILDGAPPVSAEDIRAAIRQTGMTAVEWRPQDKEAYGAAEFHYRQQVWFTTLSGLCVVAGLVIQSGLRADYWRRYGFSRPMLDGQYLGRKLAPTWRRLFSAGAL